jgi:hypothetical protein
MNVGNCVLSLAGRAWIGDRSALRDRRTFADAQLPEMREGNPVSVTRGDRHGEAVRGNRARERHVARRRGADRAGIAERDVDPTVLPGGIHVAADREPTQDRTVRGPRPRPRRRSGTERPADERGEAKQPTRCPVSEHGTTVARATTGRQCN